MWGPVDDLTWKEQLQHTAHVVCVMVCSYGAFSQCKRLAANPHLCLSGTAVECSTVSLRRGGDISIHRMAASSAKTTKSWFNVALAHICPETEHRSLMLGVGSQHSDIGVRCLCTVTALDWDPFSRLVSFPTFSNLSSSLLFSFSCFWWSVLFISPIHVFSSPFLSSFLWSGFITLLIWLFSSSQCFFHSFLFPFSSFPFLPFLFNSTPPLTIPPTFLVKSDCAERSSPLSWRYIFRWCMCSCSDFHRN